jgi:endoglucanase
MPQEDKLDRYVVMKSTAATLDFAAVMAKASRVYSKYDNHFPNLANHCLIASQKAWKWAQENPDQFYKQPSDISTGAYGDLHLEDEKNWAAIELYLTTQNENYLHQLPENFDLKSPSWQQVESLAALSLISYWNHLKKSKSKDKLERVKQNIIQTANELCEINTASAFKISLYSFAWGSNSEIANHGVVLLHAYAVTGDKKYLKTAEDCLNYLLGSNPLNTCFVTGFGDNSPKHIHDRRSSADKMEAPIPGLLVGGPTTVAKEDCGEKNYKSKFPALSYIDMECSYSTNEIAINWNAPLAFLVNALNAINQ